MVGRSMRGVGARKANILDVRSVRRPYARQQRAKMAGLNPSGSFRTMHGASKYIVSRISGVRRRPIWQAAMIGIPGPCKAFPRSTHLFGKNKSGRITATALIADLSIVKDEGDFGRMGWAGPAIIGKVGAAPSATFRVAWANA